MAKAVATCTCATCGNEFKKITTKTKRSEADFWEKWAAEYFDECQECYEKRKKEEREKETQKAMEMADEAGFPELEGSQKQIAWANKIRTDYIILIDELIESLAKGKSVFVSMISIKFTDINKVQDFRSWLLSKTESRFWIDYRREFESLGRGIVRFADEFLKEDEEEQYAEDEVVVPNNNCHETVIDVKNDADTVSLVSKYDPEIPEIAKSSGFKWNGSKWILNINFMNGLSEDRAAEIANKFLVAGFSVKIPSDIKEKAVNGTYVPEHRRWVAWNNKKEKFVIYGDVDTKNIPGCKENYAPISSCESLEEFAKLYDYRFSQGAIEEIQKYKEKVIYQTKGKEASYNDVSENIKNIFGSSRDVLDDLKDEE